MMHEKLMALVQENQPKYRDGKVAQYIPALSKVTPSLLGISIYDLRNNQLYTAGDHHYEFAIESISKVPVLLLAIQQNGLNTVFQKVDAEPTGFPFNSILNMEINHRKKPMNPFVNIGAIFMNSLIEGKKSTERFQSMLDYMKLIMNDSTLTLNDEIYHSESRTGDINRSLAYYLKGQHILPESCDVDDLLDSYFRQCSVNVTADSLAHLGALLANDGIAPWNQKRLCTSRAATVTKSLMTTAGLYDESGDFSLYIGLPAKSGVGGGLLAVAPRRYGIGIFGPALDVQGNSVAGMALLRAVTDWLDIDLFK